MAVRAEVEQMKPKFIIAAAEELWKLHVKLLQSRAIGAAASAGAYTHKAGSSNLSSPTIRTSRGALGCRAFLGVQWIIR